mgnify:CR=1 FL=1
MVLTIKDLGFAGALQVRELGHKHTEMLAQGPRALQLVLLLKL